MSPVSTLFHTVLTASIALKSAVRMIASIHSSVLDVHVKNNINFIQTKFRATEYPYPREEVSRV